MMSLIELSFALHLGGEISVVVQPKQGRLRSLLTLDGS
jgi:hypothetical protein